MPKFTIHHVTKYTYLSPVRDSANQVVLFPIQDEFQQVTKQELRISGEPEVNIYRDYYGNEIGAFMHAEPHRELVIDSRIQVITKPKPLPLDGTSAPVQWANLASLKKEMPYMDFLQVEQFHSIAEVSATCHPPDYREHSPMEAARMLNQNVFDNFRYIKGLTTVETTLDEIWKLKAGVCQDFAHMLLVMLRMIEIPARYVSGYICPHNNGMRGESATHAWVEAYIPFYGWLGLDPTNNCFANDLHVRLAVGRHFSDCSPVRGTYKGDAQHTLEVGVSVSYEDGRTIDEAPAVLKPQPIAIDPAQNSYQRHLEIMQQQQQQQ